MNPILRNILAVIASWLGGSIINMGFVEAGNRILPIPGVKPGDMDALKEVIPTLEPKYFIFPFLAHALGTLVGAFIVVKLAQGRKEQLAYLIGALFLLGGIVINYMLTGPIWFTLLDILVAYMPMAWLGHKLASGR